MRAMAAMALLLVGGWAHGYVLRQDLSGHPVRWAGPVDFAVQADIADRLGEPHALDAVRASLETYRHVLPSEKFELQVESELNVGYDLSGLAQQNTILVPPEWSFSPDAIAVTVLTVDDQTHQIVDADIAFNPGRTFRVLPAEGLLTTDADDIQNALTHELGHAIGLAHNPNLPTAVMFPTARPGETTKRVLSSDDLDAIAALYGLPPPNGCSSTGASPGWLGLAALALLALRPLRKRVAMAACVPLILALALVPLTAHAAESPRPPAPAAHAQAVLIARVTQVRTLVPDPQAGGLLLISEVTLQVDRCVKGACPEAMIVHVAGGHWGHLEQVVADAPVPAPGSSVGVILDPGADLQAPPIRMTRIYDLARERDFSAFAKGLSSAHLSIPSPPGSR